MPFYQAPHRPTFASVFRSFAQDPGLPFQQLLPEALLERFAREEGVHFGQRPNAVYTPPVTLWAFLAQCLSDTKACTAAVARVLVLYASLGRGPCSANTGAYCLARAQLPEAFLRRLTYHIGQTLEEQAERNWLWHGRPVKLVDGTVLSAPDTPANQAAYPQPSSQRRGLGFPLIRMVVLLSFATAALTGAAFGPYQGKQTGETALLRSLLMQICAGDVVVADRYQCSYWQIALLRQRGVDVAFRLHQRRRCDFGRGRRLGHQDHVVFWPRPPRPGWMSVELYESLPAQLELREVGVVVQVPGARTRTLTVVTSLLDATAYSREDIADLYHQRWHIELDLRSIKQTLHLKVLSCKTPEMLAKEIWTHLLGYNLVRQALAAASRSAGVSPRQLSFAGGVQTLNAFRWLLQCSAGEGLERAVRILWLALGTHRVGNRPNRVEPRRVKRRSKRLPLLNQPRAEARATMLLECPG
ncbi:MAG: IS4 family transposase [Chloroflexi bacterium]|nr:IS4 family transposase [Chloroflexota bacterium]